MEVAGYPESAVFHLRSSKIDDIVKAKEYLTAIVDQCILEGVALNVAARLEDIEMIKQHPPSIRISVSVEMSDNDMQMAANVIAKVAGNLHHKYC